MKKDIKNNLYRLCLENINKRMANIEKRLNAMVEARNSETKCVVGDKHETGRTMMHLEEEKSRIQYADTLKIKESLLKLDFEKEFIQVESGSLVITDNGIYFISIGIGKVKFEDNVYYCISQFSPIGEKMIGKKQGDTIEFNNNKILIQEVR